MASNQAPPPELGGEAEEQMPIQTTPDPVGQGQRLQSVAARLEQNEPHEEKVVDMLHGHLTGSTVLLSSLHSMEQACPHLELSGESTSLADEVHSCVDASNAPSLIRAVSGVDALHRHGLSPSSVALRALIHYLQDPCDHSSTDDVAAFVHNLSPTDTAELLQRVFVGNCRAPRSKQLEVVGHVREACHAAQSGGHDGSGAQLGEIIRQADAISLLRSVFQSVYGEQADAPFRINDQVAAEVASSEWLRMLAARPETAAFEETARSILADLEITPA